MIPRGQTKVHARKGMPDDDEVMIMCCLQRDCVLSQVPLIKMCERRRRARDFARLRHAASYAAVK